MLFRSLKDIDLKVVNILVTDYKLTDVEAKKFLSLYNRTDVLEKMIKDRANIAIDEVVDKVFNPKDDTATIKETDIPQGMPRIVKEAKKIDKKIKEELVGKVALKTAKQRNEEAEL